MSEGLVERVIRVVKYNTGGQQAETVTEKTTLVILAGNGSADPTVVRDALATAVNSGRLEEVDGRYRVSLNQRGDS